MEGHETVTLLVYWGKLGEDGTLEKLGKGSDVIELRKALNEHKEERSSEGVSIYENVAFCNPVFNALRPFIPRIFEFNKDLDFQMVFYAMDSGQDVFGLATWSYDPEEEVPENLQDIIVESDEIVYAATWFMEWADEHEEETAEWLSENKGDDEEFEFEPTGWRDFMDAFPAAKEEFYDHIEGL